MNSDIEAAMKTILSKITQASKAPEDMQFSQAALNLAHTEDMLKYVDRSLATTL